MSASVVIPLYQKERYVERALRSVLGQSRSDLEIIIVDDGSTDGGAGVAGATGDPRVRLLRQPHTGASAARNRGWRSARSPLVAFLDADDEWRPQFLEKTLALLERHPLLVAAFTNVTVPGRRPLLERVPAADGVVHNYFEAVLENGGVGMCSSSVVVRKSVLEACGGFPEDVSSGEDVDTWARIAWSGPLGYVPECLAEYHVPGSQATRHVTNYPALLRSFRDWSRDGKIPTVLLPASRRLANLALAEHCVELAHAGRAREARRLVREQWHGGAPWHLFLKTWVWSLVPPAVLRRLRRARASIGAST